MAELLDVLDAFSYPIKVGWVIWIAWGIGQVFWYRHERRPQSATRTAAAVSPKPVVAKKAAPAPVVQRFVTPEPVLETPAHVAQDVPTFDPAKAVVETFATPTNDLDSFVADFELRNERRRRPDPPGGSSFAAAPQAH
jgi:hypothetical protein